MEKNSLLLVLFSLAAAGSAHAQTKSELVATAAPIAMILPLQTPAPDSDTMEAIGVPPAEASDIRVAAPESAHRPKALIPLYVSMAALLASDAASTRSGLAAGAREANPLAAPFAGSTVGLAVMKVGVAASMIYASERLWKRNRKAAVLMLVITNVGYAAVVSNNLRLAQ
jgi:hypothetical protein